jgi:hypothetical protein
LVASVLAGLACAANLELTRHAPLLTTDSASYLSGADNLTSGKGLTTSFDDSTSIYHPIQAVSFHGRVPFAHFEPLYTLLIAGLRSVGLSDLSAARTIGAVSIFLIVLLLFALAYRALQGYLPLVLVFVVVTVMGPSGKGFVSGNLLELSGQVLSEPLFYAFTLGALLACAIFLGKGAHRYLVATVVLVIAATLTRYVGLSVAVATSLAILTAKTLPFLRRKHYAAVVLGFGVLAFVGWPAVDGLLSGGSTPRQFAVHLHPHLVGDLLSTASAWFFPTNWPTWFTDPAALVLLAIAVLVPFSGNYRLLVRRAGGPSPQTYGLLRLGAMFLPSYLLVVLGSSTFLDATLSLGQRVLGPMQVMAYLLLVSLLYWVVRSRTPASRALAPCVVAVVVALLLVVPNVALGYRQLRHPFPTPQPSPAMAALAKLPVGDVVFTNEPSGVFIYAHRGSIFAPARSYPITTNANPEFKEDVEYVGNLLRRRKGVIALVPDIQAPLLTVGELLHWGGLVVTRRFADGTVFLDPPRAKR